MRLLPRPGYLILILVICIVQVSSLVIRSRRSAVIQPPGRTTTTTTISWAAASPTDNSGREFLDKAAKLRREALDLENELLRRGGEKNPMNDESSAVYYRDVKNSAWTLSYLFVASPPKKQNEGENVSSSPRFSGKLTVLFREDGFTDILSHEFAAPDRNIVISKAWGWDLERSNEDDKDYVLFSIDCVLPDDKKERFYLQARQEVSGNGEIALKEGTITVKQDVANSGFPWGFFSAKGILVEFRYVGDFSAKPAKCKE